MPTLCKYQSGGDSDHHYWYNRTLAQVEQVVEKDLLLVQGKLIKLVQNEDDALVFTVTYRCQTLVFT